jgi:hypothetical protein
MIHRLKQYFIQDPTLASIEDDLFLKRIRSSVIGEGMLSMHNVQLMDYAIRKMPSEGVVLEIGSYAGLSANVILHLLNKYGKGHRMYCVDAWIYEGYNDSSSTENTEYIDGRTDVMRKDYSSYIREAFKQSLVLFQPNRLPFSFHALSRNFFKGWGQAERVDVFHRKHTPAGRLAFCYIDGNHSYEAATEDYENVMRLMLPSGFILLDDTEPHLQFGSVKLRKEIMQDRRVAVISAKKNLLVQVNQ